YGSPRIAVSFVTTDAICGSSAAPFGCRWAGLTPYIPVQRIAATGAFNGPHLNGSISILCGQNFRPRRAPLQKPPYKHFSGLTESSLTLLRMGTEALRLSLHPTYKFDTSPHNSALSMTPFLPFPP